MRLPLELKLSKYLTQIIEKMTPFFDICLKESGLWKKKDKSVTLKLPTSIIKNSIFDEILLKSQEMAVGDKTREQLDREAGLTNEEIMQKNKEIDAKKEKDMQNETPIQDKAVKEQVGSMNGTKNKIQNLDNNFKKK